MRTANKNKALLKVFDSNLCFTEADESCDPDDIHLEIHQPDVQELFQGTQGTLHQLCTCSYQYIF